MDDQVGDATYGQEVNYARDVHLSHLCVHRAKLDIFKEVVFRINQLHVPSSLLA